MSGTETFILLGLGAVFIGLICIIILCKVMSFFCRLASKEEIEEDDDDFLKATSALPVEIPNRQEFIAAVSAAIAENMGMDISGIRILSVKRV